MTSTLVASWQREYRRAHDHGWLPHFVEAAGAFDLRVEVLMGIASRESAMGGRELAPGVFEWLTRRGDGGHGYGLMQIDGRAFPDWTMTGAWKDPAAAIMKGAEVLAGTRGRLRLRAGAIVSVRDSQTKLTYRFRMPAFTGAALERAAIAAYNCGDWVGYHARQGRDVDHGTTRKNYSSDVLARAKEFCVWLVADHWITERDLDV